MKVFSIDHPLIYTITSIMTMNLIIFTFSIIIIVISFNFIINYPVCSFWVFNRFPNFYTLIIIYFVFCQGNYLTRFLLYPRMILPLVFAQYNFLINYHTTNINRY